MEIEGIRHKALRGFFLTGSKKGLPSEIAGRIGRMLQFLVDASQGSLAQPPNFGAHLLSGDRNGVWAMTVTRNWRMTFKIDDHGRIVELDLEDYH
jgi:toxin HigB-1